MAKNLIKQRERRENRKRIYEEAVDIVLKTWSEFCRRYDIANIYSWYVNEGYGPTRGPRVYLDMVENQVKMIEEFRTCADDDETYYLVMEDRLRKAGFDLEDIFNKADAIRAPVCNYEERQKMIKEYNNA